MIQIPGFPGKQIGECAGKTGKELNNTRRFSKRGVLTISRKVGSINYRVGFYLIEAMKTNIMWSFHGFCFHRESEQRSFRTPMAYAVGEVTLHLQAGHPP